MKKHGCNEIIQYEDLENIPLPPARKRFVPISHKDYFDRAVDNLGMLNYKIKDPKFIADQTRQKLCITFGLINDNLAAHNQYEFLVGLLSSTDSSMAKKLFTGSNTYNCTNQHWDGEIILSRKHTRNAVYDINRGLRDFVFTIADKQREVFANYEKLREYDFTSRSEAHDFVVETCQRDILPWQHAPKVLEHWNNPEHEEFNTRDGFSMVNAFTSHWRNSNPFTLSKKTMELRSFIDEFKNPENLETDQQRSGTTYFV